MLLEIEFALVQHPQTGTDDLAEVTVAPGDEQALDHRVQFRAQRNGDGFAQRGSPTTCDNS